MSFTCPVCGAVSHHPKDEAFGYCARCKRYTGYDDQGATLRCDICGKGIAPREFVGLDRLGPDTYVITNRGAEIGDIIDCDVWAHDFCVQNVGKQIGDIQVGRG